MITINIMEDKKVLIVDDNIQNIKLLGQLLREEGYKIAIAQSGEEALEVVLEVKPDLILLDIIMPGLNGYETCKRLKAMDNVKDIPIIFLSALKDSFNKVEGFNAGGVDYISKPIDSGELFARVNTHITLNSLQKILKEDISLKDKLIEEINEKTTELILTQKQLIESQKIASLAYLVTGMAHELNTPLSIGITSSSVIHQRADIIDKICKDKNITEEELIEAVEDIFKTNSLLMSNLKKLDNLIHDFKQLSIDQLHSNIMDFEVVQLILDSIKLNLHLLGKKHITYSVTGDKCFVKNSYPEALERVITDLTKNSVLHGFKNRESDNHISVNVSQDNSDIIIEFKDNGVGIKDDIIDNIFDPFFTTNKSTGTGLGLSVVYNIITQKLKGNIEYQRVSQETLFKIRIPK